MRSGSLAPHELEHLRVPTVQYVLYQLCLIDVVSVILADTLEIVVADRDIFHTLGIRIASYYRFLRPLISTKSKDLREYETGCPIHRQ